MVLILDTMKLKLSNLNFVSTIFAKKSELHINQKIDKQVMNKSQMINRYPEYNPKIPNQKMVNPVIQHLEAQKRRQIGIRNIEIKPRFK